MIIDNAGTYTLRYTATDDCGKTTTVDRELVVAEQIYSWTDGTDEQVISMIERADRGILNLADYWNVGDERVVHLSAMEATGVDESHAEQDVIFVLMNAGGKMLADGQTECSFIVGMKKSLTEVGYMNSTGTNVGGWESSARRAWCNNVFYNAIPSTLRPIFKQHLNKTANGGSGATAAIESVDYFALAAEYEVFGTHQYSSSIYETGLTQFEWYRTESNRRKEGGSTYWGERSPNANTSNTFCRVNSSGGANGNGTANLDVKISPFGVI